MSNIDSNFFQSFFGGLFDTPEKIVSRLDDYYERNKISEYYDLLHRTKEKYIVQRNSKGKHKLKER